VVMRGMVPKLLGPVLDDAQLPARDGLAVEVAPVA